MGMSGDRSSRRFEIVAETRRRWSSAEKQAILVEASGPCTNVSAVARRHGISPSLLFRWIKDLKPATPVPTTTFLPVALPAPAETEAVTGAEPAQQRKAPSTGASTIEIELANGRRVRGGSSVESAALKRVIALVEE